MIALKYGTVPVVRAIGGLVNTIFDRDYSDKPQHERNGYVFHQIDNRAIESALFRAICLWNFLPYGVPRIDAERNALRLLVEPNRGSASGDLPSHMVEIVDLRWHP